MLYFGKVTTNWYDVNLLKTDSDLQKSPICEENPKLSTLTLN